MPGPALIDHGHARVGLGWRGRWAGFRLRRGLVGGPGGRALVRDRRGTRGKGCWSPLGLRRRGCFGLLGLTILGMAMGTPPKPMTSSITGLSSSLELVGRGPKAVGQSE